MMKKFILLFFLSSFVIFSSASAQDTGEPVMKKIALLTTYGAMGGAALGAAVWLTDPLDDSRDLTQATIVGLGIGAIAGFVFGVQQAYKDAIIPQEYNPEPDEIFGLRENIFEIDEDELARPLRMPEPKYAVNLLQTTF